MTSLTRLTLADVAKIKPLRTTTLNLISACGQTDPDFSGIVQLIESDPVIATRVISMANSPMFGCSREINTIDRAIVILGLKSISNLVTTLGTQETVKDSAGPTELKLKLYEHLLACGIIARHLASHNTRIDPSEAFIAGILHDIGKLLFLNVETGQPLEFGALLSCEKQLELERAHFGLEHQEIGQRYADLMGLPVHISQAIGNHDNVNGDESLQSTIWQANRLCRSWGLGPQINGETPPETAMDESDEMVELEAVKLAATSEFEMVRASFAV